MSDKHSSDIVEWSGDFTQDWREQEVPNGENIVGIYGLNGYGGTGIQNIGFIITSYFQDCWAKKSQSRIRFLIMINGSQNDEKID